jgi:non-ribosomal peptide synthetase component F/nucleoside-diphosphate-sugar epimerase/SAM-dependent methyltransferase/aryl carrier-like protein/NRPS condensation-like uncharacterized protein
MAERDAARAELLRRWQRAAEGPEVRSDVDAAGPLSFAQERFALLEGLHPGHPAHVLRGRTDLRGPLDVARYEQALLDVLGAHRGLRTRFFQDEEGRWRQQVVAIDALPLSHRQAEATVDDGALERELGARLERLAAAPFDLGRAPLMRLELVRVHAEHHVLLSAVHHLAVDGLALLAWGQDVAERYRAAGSERPAPSAPECDPLDLARWQRTRHAAGFWRAAAAERIAALAELPELELPADRPRPPDGATRGARCTLPLNDELRAAVRAQARAFTVTPFQVYLAAFAAELHASSGQEAFAIGTPASGREHPAARGVIGYLSNSVAIPSQRGAADSWRAWVRSTAERASQALAAAEVPFEHLARELDPTGDRAQLARHPVFQVLFNYLDFTPAELDAGDLGIAYRARPAGTLFDLSLYVHDSPEQGLLEFEYEALRFEAVTARRLLERVRRRLELGCAEPESAAALQLTENAEERRRRERLEGRARVRRLRRGGVASRVEQQVRRQPDAIAVAWRANGEDRAWTYAQLWRRVEQWSVHLDRAGLCPGDRLAWAPKSDGDALALPLALERLGVESCALPLDLAPEPRARLAALLDPRGVWLPDERATAWRSLWPSERSLGAPDFDATTEHELQFADDLALPAYRLHTSGTTGQPKGVLVSRAAWVAFLDAAVARLGRVAAGRWLAITPATFDIHLLERFAPLIAGGSVELVEPAEATSGERLAARLERARPQVFQATPSTHRLLELAGYEGDGAAHWLIGGEPWYPGLAARAHAQAGAVWNAYGPTEATVWVSLTRLLPGDPVHLGRPLRGTAWRVADERGAPVPLGAPGELWLSGPQLAQGYADDPARTAAGFPELDGRRWYRTGDRVRFDGAGRLLHLGRSDDQIKLRGQRLELGAVEAALAEVPGVAAAAVAFDAEAPEGGTLVALLVAADDVEAPTDASVDATVDAGWAAVWSHVFEHDSGPGAGWIDPEHQRPFELDALRALAQGFAGRVVSELRDPEKARLLEVGAGGGLVAAALGARVAKLVAQEPDDAARARLSRVAGVDRVLGGRLGSLGAELRAEDPFDAILLHSVVQYLGSVAALIAGLEELRGALAPEGCLVLGDLLAPAEHAERPEELAIDPSSWERWAAAHPAVRSAEVRTRENDPDFADAPELLRGRYDVVLRFDGPLPLSIEGLEAIGSGAPVAAPDAEPEFLRRALRGRLPAGQIPSAFRWVSALPRSSAGKLDRRAVLAAVRAQPAPGDTDEAAEDFAGDPLASSLAALWHEVLGSPARHDAHFFEAGGHSLSAARFAALARERIPAAAQLELADLLRWPRFGDLRAHLDSTSASQAGLDPIDPLVPSGAQRRLLVLEALDPGRATYHVAFELRGSASLEHGRLPAALAFLAQRHRALGLALEHGDDPGRARWIEASAALPVEGFEPETDFDAAAFAARPFDLTAGSSPLWRAAWASTPDDWRVVWVLHHLIADARSVAVLTGELAAWLGGANLEPLRADFDDLQASARRRDHTDAERTAQWAERLRPSVFASDWPAAFAPAQPIASDAAAALHELPVDSHTAAAFAKLAASHGVSEHALLLALAAEWLRGLTGQSRFCLGSTLSGRGRESLADAVGFASATVVVPFDLEALEPGIVDLAARASDAWTAALEHADVGFEALVAELAPERDRQRPPVFQVAVDHLGGSDLGRWEQPAGVELRELTPGPAKFEITVQWIEAESTRLRFEFDARRFGPATRERLVAEFGRRLQRWLETRSATADPVDAVATQGDAHAIPIVRRFTERARADASALAWQRGSEAHSYGDLTNARRRWSGALSAAGVSAGQRVGVALEDPGEFALALLSLWALGAVPVALQAGDGSTRRSERLQAAGCRGWIGAHPDAWSPAQLEGGAPVLEPDADELGDARYEALILFTSGTSGRPKAVRIGQASLAHYLDWAAQRYALERGAIAFTDPAFDLGLTCALGPWWSGGALHTGAGADPLERLESCLDHGEAFGALKLTPTHLRALTGAGLTPRLDGRLEHLVIGGERLDFADLADLRALNAAPQVHNEYGPTEATVAVCAARYDLSETSLPHSGAVPVCDGEQSFIAEARWSLVDDSGADVTPATPGELWLAGRPLALGYDDAEATHAAFVERDGTRWYRTGDRALATAGGLVILGRVDHELKVRGVRVDPEELEQRLSGLPGVESVAVDLRIRGERPELIAFCVGEAGLPPEAAALEALLPRALWPDRWQSVDRLPVRGHGKLDRGQVAQLSLAEADATAASPGDWPPHPLSDVLRDLLGNDARPDLDFFANGGDSIAALSCSARARQLGWELSVAALFEADSLLTALNTAREGIGVELRPRTGLRGLTAAQSNYAAGLGEPDAWDVQALDVRLPQSHSHVALRRALDRLVARHGALRTAFRKSDGRWMQEELAEGVAQVARADSDTWSEAAPQAFSALSLEQGRLFGALLDGAEQGDRLLLFAHHLAVDAQAWRILLRDFEVLLQDDTANLGQAVPASAFSPEPGTEASDARPAPSFGSEGDARRVRRDVSPGNLERYARLAANHALPPVDQALATALGVALASEFGIEAGLHLESQGRRLPGAAAAVGFFSEWWPVESSDAEAFDRDAAASLRTLTHSRWNARMAEAGQANALLNHLGRWRAPESAGLEVRPFGSAPLRAPEAQLRVRHEVRSSERDGVWSLEWIAGGDVEADAVERALDALLARFAQLLDALEGAPSQALTPSGFGLPGAADAWTNWSSRETAITDVAELTPTQLGMLLESLERPDSPAYREQFWLEMAEPLEAARLEVALRALARRHPALRSVFPWRGLGRPVRAVRRDAEVSLEVLDARSLDCVDRDAQWEQRLARGRVAAWDLEGAPPWRAVLQRRGEQRSRVLFEYHHLLLDGWSLPTLLGDLERALEGAELASRQTPQRFAEPGEARGGAADDRAARAWWDARFGDFGPAPRRLLREFATPEGQANVAHRATHRVQRQLLTTGQSRAIEDGARAAGATPALLLQAAWARVLQRFGGSRDVAFALTQSGREAEGNPDGVGAFLRTVAVRAPESWRDDGARRDPWSPEDLSAWRADAAERAPHEVLPLARQLAVLDERPDRVLESLVVFENYPRPEDSSVGGRARWIDAGGFERTPYPLTWIAVPGERWSVELCAEVGRVDAHLQRALFESLLEELRATSWDPRRWDGPLEGTPPEAEDAEVELWSALGTDPERELWSTPERVWTAGEIARTVERRSAALSVGGVEPGAVVAVDLEDPLERALCLLAVWAAGAAPWTVDRDDAPARRARAAELAQPSAWIGDRPAPDGCSVQAPTDLDIDVDGAPRDPVVAGSLGVLAFTSGSTGEPKGIELPRAPFFAKLRTIARRYGWRDSDTLVAFAAPGFDTAYEELLGSLFAGARLHLDAELRRLSFAELEERLGHESWTLLDLPTAYWNAWALERATAAPVSTTRLRQVVLGGQAVDPRALAAWRRRWPEVEVLNSYGPTEAAIVSVAGALGPAEARTGAPSIGRPLPDVDVALRGASEDQDWIGELLLREGAVRTAERRADGRREFDAALPYATGDVVLRGADGRLRFLGRADAQVKLRGHRVELAEIEAVLARLEVDARAALDADGRLVVGYLGAQDPERIAQHLRRELPGWMQPAELAALDDWPRTARGKLDRDALALRVRERRQQVATVATESADPWVERARAAFAEALGVDAVDPDARLEELGGDSLVALSIASRFADSAATPRLAALLEQPTARAWARELERVAAGPGPDASDARERAWVAADELWRATPDPGWRFASSDGAADGTLLVTGATGMLGAHVVAELAREFPDRPIAVAVRGADDAACARRWQERWSEVKGGLPADRAEVWRADLSQPRFGWDWETSQARRRQVDQVIHAAANTSAVVPRERSLRDNLDSTRRLLDWLSDGPACQLFAVSTLGLFDGIAAPPGAPWDESTPLSALGRQSLGYPASKWLAEQLLAGARRQGLALTVLRPGRLLPDWSEYGRDPWGAALMSWASESQALLSGELLLDLRSSQVVARDVALAVVAGAAGAQVPRVLHLDPAAPWSFGALLDGWVQSFPGWRRVAWEELIDLWRPAAERRGEAGMLAALDALIRSAADATASPAVRVDNRASHEWFEGLGRERSALPFAGPWAQLSASPPPAGA